MFASMLFISLYALERQKELLREAEQGRRAEALHRAARAERAARRAAARAERDRAASLHACQIEPPALRCTNEEHQGDNTQSA
jgi:hypothetical protein